jgi:ElaB/YqjD/DUF883 family membrane-anchored ribosome-binding protein
MTNKKNTISNEINDDWANIKEKTRDATQALTEAANHLRSRAEEVFQDSFEDLGDKSAELQENVVKYIKKHPVKSVGIATLAGLFISHLLKK